MNINIILTFTLIELLHRSLSQEMKAFLSSLEKNSGFSRTRDKSLPCSKHPLYRKCETESTPAKIHFLVSQFLLTNIINLLNFVSTFTHSKAVGFAIFT